MKHYPPTSHMAIPITWYVYRITATFLKLTFCQMIHCCYAETGTKLPIRNGSWNLWVILGVCVALWCWQILCYDSSRLQRGVLAFVLSTSGARFLKRKQSLYKSNTYVLLHFSIYLKLVHSGTCLTHFWLMGANLICGCMCMSHHMILFVSMCSEKG